MPFDANGIYTLPPGYFVQVGMDVLPSQHNPPFEDIRQALSGVLLRSGIAPMTGILQMGGNKIEDIGAATNPGDAVRYDQFLAALPVGFPAMWPAEDPPDGWLEMDGSAISRVDFSELFAVIGTRYGAGDGSTTFNIPDDRGIFVRGYDNGAGIDPGRVFGSFQDSSVESHTHSVNPPSTSLSISSAGSHNLLIRESSGGDQTNDPSGRGYAGADNFVRWSSANNQSIPAHTHSGSVNIPTFASGSYGGGGTYPANRSYLPIIRY